jgi:hypothetical protein
MASGRLAMTIEQVANRLRELGMNSPDPAATIQAAMKLWPKVS